MSGFVPADDQADEDALLEAERSALRQAAAALQEIDVDDLPLEPADEDWEGEPGA